MTVSELIDHLWTVRGSTEVRTADDKPIYVDIRPITEYSGDKLGRLVVYITDINPEDN